MNGHLVVEVVRPRQENLVSRIGAGQQRQDHGLVAARRDDDLPVGIKGDPGVALPFGGQGGAEFGQTGIGAIAMGGGIGQGGPGGGQRLRRGWKVGHALPQTEHVLPGSP